MGRFAHIDVLRGLAALSVAYFHFFGGLAIDGGAVSFVDAIIVRVITDWLDLGRTAVLLFFIISGYVVARSVTTAPDHNVARFAIRRLFRLYPMYWAALGIYLLMAGTHEAADIWQNIAMIQVPGWPRLTIVSIAWTMTVEVAFYIVCACLFLLGILQHPRGLAAVVVLFLGLAALSALGRAYLGFHIPFEWPLFLSLMFAGALLRELDERGMARRGTAVAVAMAGYLPIVLGLSLLMFWDESVYHKSWYRHFNAYAAAILIFLGVHYFCRIRNRLLSYLGRISYSIYLLHAPIGGMVIFWLEKAGLDPHSSPHLSMALILSFTIVASMLTYQAVEAPCVRLSHRLAGALGHRPAAGAGQGAALGENSKVG